MVGGGDGGGADVECFSERTDGWQAGSFRKDLGGYESGEGFDDALRSG